MITTHKPKINVKDAMCCYTGRLGLTGKWQYTSYHKKFVSDNFKIRVKDYHINDIGVQNKFLELMDDSSVIYTENKRFNYRCLIKETPKKTVVVYLK